ncbi:MAG: hypothetical protein AVO35_08340 [Candidatus Aegiribacteria sp. MLS_C]|nr:MAG: hypothetical protein AVO35_08340 [Candidatus Aegiribacteria sp. MLS_C]
MAQKTVLRKPKGFIDVYKYKPGEEKDRTHYCPGCGHGIIHKLIAEALEDFDIVEKSIVISPVGCSVFAYYYFDTGNLQVAHGRAPAVGTAVSRANPDSVVISYQGDGDLAAIGGNNILQAANRGENMVVVFVNNAIYGMTGGQMAPTTLTGQKTTTTPYGRNPVTDGYPLQMCELISQLTAPVYVTRTSLHDMPGIRKARAAIRKGIQNAMDRKGFSFVEVLSMCPSGWKMEPVQAQDWIRDRMLERFPTGTFRDSSDEAVRIERPVPVMDPEKVKEILGYESLKTSNLKKNPNALFNKVALRVAGFGGQGIMSTGIALANVGMEYGYKVSWLPSYGPEMRGGTANCSVKVQEETIGAAECTEPNMVIAMNQPSLEKFERILVPDGVLMYNSTLIEVEPTRKDLRVYPIPVTGMADALGDTRVQSMVNVGAFAAITGMFDPGEISGLMSSLFGGKSEKVIQLNEEAVRKGYDYVRENFS